MKPIWLFAALLLARPLLADSADLWILRGHAAQNRFDTQAALAAFLRADQERPNDPRILQAIARQYSDSTLDTADPAERQRRTEIALAYAKRALALAPRDPVNVLSLAVCYGKLGMEADVATRIADAKLVKQYAEQAIALDPKYDYAHHVLGEWNTDVALLGRTKLFLIKLVYGGLPNASTAEGVAQLKIAVALAPTCPSHWTDLGHAYLANGQPEEARQAYQKAIELPKSEKYDDEAKRQARAALQKLS
jgi:Flp pilus assembly protein TadD